MEILNFFLLISLCVVSAKNIPNAKQNTPSLPSSSHISSESADSVSSIEEVDEQETDLSSSERSAVKSQYTDGLYSQEIQRINQRYNTNRLPLTPALREMQENMLDNQLNFREQIEQDYLDYLEDSRQQQANLLERQHHLRANMQREYLNQQEKVLKENHNIDKERSKMEKKTREALKKRQNLLKKQLEVEKKQAKQIKKMKELQDKVRSKIEQLEYKNMILNHMSSPQAELARKKVQEQKTLLEAVHRFVINFVKLNEPPVGSFDSGSSNGLSTTLYMNDEVSSDIHPFSGIGGNGGGIGGGMGSGMGGGMGGGMGVGIGESIGGGMRSPIVNDEMSSDVRKPGSPSPTLMMNDEISSDIMPSGPAAILGNDEISSDVKKQMPMSSLYRPIYGRPNILMGNDIYLANGLKPENSRDIGTAAVVTPTLTIRLDDKSSNGKLKGIKSHNLASSTILQQIPSNIADDYSSQDKMNGVGPYANPAFRITPTSSDGISSDDILKGLGSPVGSLPEQNVNSMSSAGSAWGFRDDVSLVTTSNVPVVTSIISNNVNGPYANPAFRITTPSSISGSSSIFTQIPSNIADDYSSQDKMNGVGPYSNPAFRITPPSSDGISSDDILKGLGSPVSNFPEQNVNSMSSAGSSWGFRDDGSLATTSNVPIVTSIISDAIKLSENSQAGSTDPSAVANDEVSSDIPKSGEQPKGKVKEEKSSDVHDSFLSDVVSFDKSSSSPTDLNIDSIIDAAISEAITTATMNNEAAPDVTTANIDKIASIAPAASNVEAATIEPSSISGSTPTSDNAGETVVPLTSANTATADTVPPADSVTLEVTTTTNVSVTTKPVNSVVSDSPVTDFETVTPEIELTTNSGTAGGATTVHESPATESADTLTTTSTSEPAENVTVAITSATAIAPDANPEESQFTTTDTITRTTTESGFDPTSPVDDAMLDPVLSTLINSWTASESGANLLSLGL